MKYILIIIVLLTLTVTADTYSVMAEKVSTTQIDSVATDVIQDIPDGYDWGWIVTIAIAILETIARVYPTKKNLSIISLIVRLLNIILPNLKKKQKPTDKSKFES